jgi:hypothetical protein
MGSAMERKLDWPLRIGLLLASFAWVSYIFYDFNIAIFRDGYSTPWRALENLPGTWGSGLRLAAAAIIAIAALYLIAKKDLSKPELIISASLIAIFEATYFLAFLGGALNFHKTNFFTLPLILEQGLPCAAMGILTPIVLLKLFFQLKASKPLVGAIKWTLIYLSVYIFIFWLNNAGYWIAAVALKGINYISQYQVNLFSFIITVFGLLALMIYAFNFTRKSIQGDIIAKLNLKKVGLIITSLGLYPVLIFLLWLIFGSVGGWGTWYAWFLGHAYMTFTSTPLIFIGLALMFRPQVNGQSVKQGNPEQLLEARARPQLQIKRKTIDSFVFLTQGLGFVFFTIYSLAYYITIPSRNTLIGDPTLHPLMLIFGVMFFVLTLIVLVISKVAKSIE